MMSKAIPVLYYHRVNHVDQRMAVRPELFLGQMQRLRKKGWRALGLKELLAFLQGGALENPCSLVITFDDGFFDNWYYAFPIIRRTGMKAIIFLVTDWVREAGEPRPLFDPAAPAGRGQPAGFRTLNQSIGAARSGDRQDFLRASEVKALAESGLFEFGSHTRSHQPCFASPRIKQFLLTPSPHWAKRALVGDQVRPGIPLYEWASAVTVPRYRDDPQLREGLARFLEGQGGFAAVRQKGREFWTRRLRVEAERLKRQSRGGEYETEPAATARILEDLSASRVAVEEISGQPCRALGWPWGHHSALGVRLAKQAGYQLGFTTQTGAVCPGEEALLLPRLRVSGRTRPATLEKLLRVLAYAPAAKLARSLSRSQSQDGLLSPGLGSPGRPGEDLPDGK